MDSLVITKVTSEDISQLQSISRQTFSETFAASNTAENMDKYLAESFSTEKLRAEISNPNSRLYFAELHGAAIGYMKLNFGRAQTELKDDNALEIERIYVLHAYHGNKVGQLLFEKAIQVAIEMEADYVWLGVWEKNERAIQFYKKNGFVEFDKHIFKLGDDAQTDIMMKLQLKA